MVQNFQSDVRFELAHDFTRPLPETIAEKLAELVADGTFAPGTRLPNESELARLMHVARSSVRTALQRLETQGVLEVRRGRGWFVRRGAPAGDSSTSLLASGQFQVADVFEMRMAMEGLAASLAAVRATSGELADLDKLSKLHADAGEDRDELLRTDQEFHLAVVRAGRNELLISTYPALVDELTEWRYASYADRGAAVRSGREHSRIVRFLRNHDSAGSRAAMNSHLERLYLSLPNIGDGPVDLSASAARTEPTWKRPDSHG